MVRVRRGRRREARGRSIAKLALTAIAVFAIASPALAADPGQGVSGATLGAAWAIPFVGLLLSIAVMPLAAPSVWHHHFGKITLGWSALVVLPFLLLHGIGATAYHLVHTAFAEYVPFIILVGALFTIAGGVWVRGNIHGSPATNTGLLAIGTAIASVTGTTGAAMLMIRPVIRANDERLHNAHVVVFFIFLVANVGGSLTPVGDPPLFLGFLLGVDFFWPTTHLLAPMALVSAILLAVFYALDSVLYHRDAAFKGRRDPTPDGGVRIEGGVNVVLLGGVVLAVLMSGALDLGVAFTLLGTPVKWQNLLRDLTLLVLAGLSLRLTPPACREGNGFSWGPIVEVAKLFAGIFTTIIPVLAMLRAGEAGAFAWVHRLLTAADGTPNEAMYFWLSGGLSSFLDNAPTYLVFFNAAGGDPAALMGPLAGVRSAFSAGSVCMGADTCSGNAPNFMVKAIAEENGVKMPSFFGYMAWSCGILIPCFVLVTFVFFR